MLSPEELRALPKVALHDHLDGGLRPSTVIEHCAENRHELPTTGPEKLGQVVLRIRRLRFPGAISGGFRPHHRRHANS